MNKAIIILLSVMLFAALGNWMYAIHRRDIALEQLAHKQQLLELCLTLDSLRPEGHR